MSRSLAISALIAGVASASFAATPVRGNAGKAGTTAVSARTPLPTDRLHFGLQSDEGAQLTWLQTTKVPVRYRYQYLVDGVNTGGGSTSACGPNGGWQTWASPAGAFVTNYINDTVPSRIPVFTYYQLVPSNPAAGSDATADEMTKITTLCTMQAYWSDYTVLLQKVGAYGGQAVIHVEPDFWGNMETSGTATTAIAADVANTGNADLAGLPNTVQGMAWAYLKLRDKYAPNALLAIHVNNWQGGLDLSTDQSTPVSGAPAVADAISTWIKPAGFVGNPSGVSTWDLVFNDVADHDAASYNPLTDPHWWDKTNVLLPNFARWLAFMSRLHSDLAVPLVVWQVPVGNQYYDTENNTSGHYQDNRVEYFLGHISDLTAAGIVAVLIGKANSGQTNYIDDMADGVTNPAPVTSFGCNLCNNHTSTVSDDDGGYIRNFITAYYNGSGPVCPASSTVPCYDHIFTILMENTAYSSIKGSPGAPYINSLVSSAAVAANYFATDHPSLPNYLELTSASNDGITTDCTPPGTGCTANVSNIADLVESSGRTWKAYEETAPGTCPTSDSGLYATKHDPFVYYDGIRTNSTRCNGHVVPYTQLANDLGSASSTPNYAFITPNLCDDMHDCSIQTGDTWLSNNVPVILASPAFTTQKSLLVIVWDEDDGTSNNQVAWIGVGFGVKTNYMSSAQYNHYSFLKTIETAWGLPTLTTNDGSATAMSDLFGTVNPNPLAATAAGNPASGRAPLIVNFTGSATGGIGPYTYSWSFGDGSTSTSQSPSHAYSSAGTFSAMLTVTDSAANTTTASAPPVTVTPSAQWTYSLTGDFNGDGKPDVAYFDASTGQWWVGISTGTGFTETLWTTWSTHVTWVDVQVGDFNGDGKADIIGRALETGQWWVALSTGTGFTNSLWATWSPSVTWSDVHVADFNGDGKADIIGRAINYGQWWVGLSTGTAFTTTLWATWSPSVTWVDVHVADFNGDGKADIIGRAINYGQWWVGLSTGTAFTTTLWATWSPSVTWVDVHVADFNGDGKADIIGRASNYGQWWVGLSSGTAFTTTLWATWSPSVTWVDVHVADFNGDGKADIIGRAINYGQWWVGLSTGTAFTTTLWATWSPSVPWVDVQVGDFNGDGKADIIGRASNYGQWWVGVSTGTAFTTTLWASWSPSVTWVDVHVADFNADGKADIEARALEYGQLWVGLSSGTAFTTTLWATLS